MTLRGVKESVLLDLRQSADQLHVTASGCTAERLAQMLPSLLGMHITPPPLSHPPRLSDLARRFAGPAGTFVVDQEATHAIFNERFTRTLTTRFGTGDDMSDDDDGGSSNDNEAESGGASIVLLEVTLHIREIDGDVQEPLITLKTYIRPPDVGDDR